MKYTNKLLRWLLLTAFIITSCTETDDPIPLGRYSDGIWVVNEGNFTDGNGSLSFWVPDSSLIINDAFRAENGSRLGGIIQQMVQQDNRLLIITNASDQIINTDANTLENTITITDESIVSPFNVTVLNNKAYVTTWGSGENFPSYPDASVKIIDLATSTLIKTIDLGERPMGILSHQGSVYVANEQGDQIEVIDPATDEIVSSISLTLGEVSATGPSKMIAQGNTLWVLCSNNDFSSDGFLVEIDLSDNSVTSILTEVPVSGFNEKFVLYESTLYLINDEFVYTIDTTAPVTPTTAFITAPFTIYGIGVDPTTGNIYVGESEFGDEADVIIYNQAGTQVTTFTAGIGVNSFVF
ncbi:MAG: DUF5074 domain-containing protein [Bacteroidota bacterium]